MTEQQKEERTPDTNPAAGEFVNFINPDKDGSHQLLDQAEKKHKSSMLERNTLAKATELAEKVRTDNRRKHRSTRLEIRRRGAPSKKQLKTTFTTEMISVHAEMPFANRIVSRIIHTLPIEKAIEFIGTTLARPNAMFSGSVTAFTLTTIIYFVARHYGYKLSGFETIAAFIVGWVIGILYDYAVNFIRRHKS